MEKLPIQNDAWDIVKWSGGLMMTIILALGRVFFGDIRETQKEHGKRLDEFGTAISDIKIDLAKISEYLHTLKNNTAFAQHVERKTRYHAKKINRLERKNAG